MFQGEPGGRTDYRGNDSCFRGSLEEGQELKGGIRKMFQRRFTGRIEAEAGLIEVVSRGI